MPCGSEVFGETNTLDVKVVPDVVEVLDIIVGFDDVVVLDGTEDPAEFEQPQSSANTHRTTIILFVFFTMKTSEYNVMSINRRRRGETGVSPIYF